MPITHPDVVQVPPTTKGIPSVLVRDLHFTYPDGLHALRGVSLAIASGEKVALVGPNGAGKSTFILHLNGILMGEGDITVAGLPLKTETLPQIRAKVGMVFQSPDDQLFSPTVFEDVAFGPLHIGYDEATVRQRVAEALEAVGMSEFAQRVPHHMSVGQKKRIAIATVLAMHPDILVLDEPTAGLDPRGRRELMKLLDRLPLTMLVSTHDMPFVRDSFVRTVVMSDGQIVADGATTEILANDTLLQQHGLEKP